MSLLFKLFLSFGLIMRAEANLPSESKTRCEAEMNSKLTEISSQDQWTRIIDPKPQYRAYRTPTHQIGTWIEINLGENPVLTLMTPKIVRRYEWNSQDCSLITTKEFEQNSIYFKFKGPSFRDEDLKKLLDQKKNALIYMFSPAMTYSVKMMERLASAALELHLKFIPLLDPTVENFEMERIPYLRGKVVRKAASVELLMREMFVHFPTSLVIYNGKILDPFIFGVMSSEDFKKEIRNRINLQGKNI